jgi:hypothetical protein
MKAIALFLALAFALLLAFTSSVFASCECRCVDGESQAVCSSSLEVPPICSRQSCPVTPSMSPVGPLNPPIGSGLCDTVQVFNRRTGHYDTKQLCR